MNISTQIAKQLRVTFNGGNWTGVNLKDSLAGITWEQATAKINSFNTIAALLYHIGYYVTAATKVLEGGPLDSHDKYAFDCPTIQSEKDWEKLKETTRTNVEKMAALIEQLSDGRMSEVFNNEKYGTYYRNLTGIIEHAHYHLGQIVLIRKLLDTSHSAS